MTVSDLEKRNVSLELWRKWCDANAAMFNALDGLDDRAYEDLEKATNDAHAAYEASGVLIETDDGTDIERCAITGVPLYVKDDVVLALRSALPGKREEAA